MDKNIKLPMFPNRYFFPIIQAKNI